MEDEAELVGARPQGVLGQDVDAAGPRADAVDGVVDEQVGVVVDGQLVRVPRLVQLLGGVAGEREPGAVAVGVGAGAESEPGLTGITQVEGA